MNPDALEQAFRDVGDVFDLLNGVKWPLTLAALSELLAATAGTRVLTARLNAGGIGSVIDFIQRRHPEAETGFSVFISQGEVTLANNVHSNQKLSAGPKNALCDGESNKGHPAWQKNVDRVRLGNGFPVRVGNLSNAGRLKAAFIDDLLCYDRSGCIRYPRCP